MVLSPFVLQKINRFVIDKAAHFAIIEIEKALPVNG